MAARNPGAIPAAKVTIRPGWLVDCTVCKAGVETEEDITSYAEAREARARHLAEHARGEYPEREL